MGAVIYTLCLLACIFFLVFHSLAMPCIALGKRWVRRNAREVPRRTCTMSRVDLRPRRGLDHEIASVYVLHPDYVQSMVLSAVMGWVCWRIVRLIKNSLIGVTMRVMRTIYKTPYVKVYTVAMDYVCRFMKFLFEADLKVHPFEYLLRTLEKGIHTELKTENRVSGKPVDEYLNHPVLYHQVANYEAGIAEPRHTFEAGDDGLTSMCRAAQRRLGAFWTLSRRVKNKLVHSLMGNGGPSCSSTWPFDRAVIVIAARMGSLKMPQRAHIRCICRHGGQDAMCIGIHLTMKRVQHKIGQYVLMGTSVENLSKSIRPSMPRSRLCSTERR